MGPGVRSFGEWGTEKMWMEDPQPDVSSCGGQSRVKVPTPQAPSGRGHSPGWSGAPQRVHTARPHPCVFCKERHKRGPDWKSIL